MQPNLPEALSLEPGFLVDPVEFAHMCGLSIPEVDELVEYGALAPAVTGSAGRVKFSSALVPPLRRALKLRDDFDLDLFTVSVLVSYLQRIAELEHEVRVLRAHLPRAVGHLREGPATWREPHA